MSPRSLFPCGLAILILGPGFALLSQTPGQPISTTYIFSQAICLATAPAPPLPLPGGCAPQTVPAGATVEIQLPGGPSVWREFFVSPGLVRLRPLQIIASPGRIEGTDKIFLFRYRLLPGGVGAKETLTFAEGPPFVSKPVGKLTYTVLRK